MKITTNINCPKEWEITDDWDSHKPLLWLALQNTNGKVVEMGSGFGSTPLLKNFCTDTERDFVTYETNKDWAEKTDSIFVDTYFKKIGKIGVLFIDCAPGELRKELILEYKDDADAIVVHDTEPTAEYVYGMKEVLDSFNFRLDYQPQGKPHTTIISNKTNIEKWA